MTMPQEFQVLRCYKCETFQVQQIKKTTKWQCKMCGEKQSVKKVYGRGTGKDCRCHVQRLNTMRGELVASATASITCNMVDFRECVDNTFKDQSQTYFRQPVGNKWSMYVREEDVYRPDTDGEDWTECMYTTDASLFQRGRKRKREQIDRTSTGDERNLKQCSSQWDEYSTTGRFAPDLHQFGYSEDGSNLSKSKTMGYKSHEKVCSQGDIENSKSFANKWEKSEKSARSVHANNERVNVTSSKWNSYVSEVEQDCRSDSEDNLGKVSCDYDCSIDGQDLLKKSEPMLQTDFGDKENHLETSWLPRQTNKNSADTTFYSKTRMSDSPNYDGFDCKLNIDTNNKDDTSALSNSGKQSKWWKFLNYERPTECLNTSVKSESKFDGEKSEVDTVYNHFGVTFSVGELSEEDFDL